MEAEEDHQCLGDRGPWRCPELSNLRESLGLGDVFSIGKFARALADTIKYLTAKVPALKAQETSLRLCFGS
jgi:hypothetical protein